MNKILVGIGIGVIIVAIIGGIYATSYNFDEISQQKDDGTVSLVDEVGVSIEKSEQKPQEDTSGTVSLVDEVGVSIEKSELEIMVNDTNRHILIQINETFGLTQP